MEADAAVGPECIADILVGHLAIEPFRLEMATGDGGAGSIGGAASVQWSNGSGSAIRIGDAALARDALASQGIANGISAGLTLFESPGAQRSYFERTRTELHSHLSTLRQLIRTCAYREHPFWDGYAKFLGCDGREHAGEP